MEKKTAPYMLIFRDTETAYQGLSAEQRQQALSRWNAWFDDLAARGKLTDGRPLERTGRTVTGPTGRVTDGPFAEAKESVGGFFLLTVADLEEATEIARRCPGLAHGINVEVRPVAEICPVLHGAGTMSHGAVAAHT